MWSRMVNWEVAQVNNHFTHQRARCKFYLGQWQLPSCSRRSLHPSCCLGTLVSASTILISYLIIFHSASISIHYYNNNVQILCTHYSPHLGILRFLPREFQPNSRINIYSCQLATPIQYKPSLCSTAVWLVHSYSVQTVSLFYCRMIGPLISNTNRLFVLLSYDFAKIPHNLLLLVG